MNKTREIMSIVAVTSAAAIIVLPGVLSNPVWPRPQDKIVVAHHRLAGTIKTFRVVFPMRREQKDMLQKRK
jgi:hypothetical protein